MTGLTEILESIYSVVKTMNPVDFIDIALLSYIIYFFLKLIKETRVRAVIQGHCLSACGIYYRQIY